MRTKTPVTRTQHGFEWKGTHVAVLHTDDRYGMWLRVEGKRGSVELRVTPGGRVEVVKAGNKDRAKK